MVSFIHEFNGGNYENEIDFKGGWIQKRPLFHDISPSLSVGSTLNAKNLLFSGEVFPFRVDPFTTGANYFQTEIHTNCHPVNEWRKIYDDRRPYPLMLNSFS